jgi:hypothetical protein
LKTFLTCCIPNLESIVIDLTKKIFFSLPAWSQVDHQFVIPLLKNRHQSSLYIDLRTKEKKTSIQETLDVLNSTFRLTNWFINDVFPTPESPKIITLSKTFFREVIFNY